MSNLLKMKNLPFIPQLIPQKNDTSPKEKDSHDSTSVRRSHKNDSKRYRRADFDMAWLACTPSWDSKQKMIFSHETKHQTITKSSLAQTTTNRTANSKRTKTILTKSTIIMTYMTLDNNSNLYYNQYNQYNQCNDELTSNDGDFLLGLLNTNNNYDYKSYQQSTTTTSCIITPEPIIDNSDNNEHLILAASILLQEDNNSDDEDTSLEPLPLHYNSSNSTIESCDSTDSLDTSSYSEIDILPTEFDVLCGQSRTYASHSGNCRFQTMLEEYLPKYSHESTTKQQKMILTKEIVSRISMEGGRFLKVKADGFWEEISTVRARDKVGHALRTKVAALKRKMNKKN